LSLAITVARENAQTAPALLTMLAAQEGSRDELVQQSGISFDTAAINQCCPDTLVGDEVELVSGESPSSPRLFDPQQYVAPDVVRPQL
jgi:hypothetical protein